MKWMGIQDKLKWDERDPNIIPPLRVGVRDNRGRKFKQGGWEMS